MEKKLSSLQKTAVQNDWRKSKSESEKIQDERKKTFPLNMISSKKYLLNKNWKTFFFLFFLIVRQKAEEIS